MTKITKGNLRDQTGHNGPRSILYCSVCGGEYSANSGDYFTLPDSHVFKCCGFPMSKVIKSTIFKHVDKEVV